MEQQTFYNAAIYCRLSKDDDLHGESSSISTQKNLLTKYVIDNNWRVVDYYIDDGISGTTFERSGFKRMLEDIEEGKINMVVTKDLSRLGRDYLKTGYYTEVYFPENNVRYIAVNDGIDTIKNDNDIAPFKNILNEMYAKDISRKIKSAYKIKMARGDQLLSMLTEEENKQKQKEYELAGKEYKNGEARLAELEILLQRLFEENVAGRLNDANYTTMFARYQQEQEQLIVRVQELKRKLSVMNENIDNCKKWIDLIAKYKDLQELDAPIINELCEKILIHEPEKINGKRTQKIEIFYRFVGNIPHTCENINN